MFKIHLRSLIKNKNKKKGDLSIRIAEAKSREEPILDEEIWKWMYGSACGLAYLHAERIIHRDIKPAYKE